MKTSPFYHSSASASRGDKFALDWLHMKDETHYILHGSEDDIYHSKGNEAETEAVGHQHLQKGTGDWYEVLEGNYVPN